jgi:hypothetical protein
MKSFLLIGLLLQVFALPTLCVFAWFRGGVTERRIATALFIAVVATTTTDVFGTRWQGPNWGVITVDVILMIAKAQGFGRYGQQHHNWGGASRIFPPF